MRRTRATASDQSNDFMSTPLDWRELGGQIRAVARQLASMHVATLADQGRCAANEHSADLDYSSGGEQSE